MKITRYDVNNQNLILKYVWIGSIIISWTESQ